jgi:hypothetical protein
MLTPPRSLKRRDAEAANEGPIEKQLHKWELTSRDNLIGYLRLA